RAGRDRRLRGWPRAPRRSLSARLARVGRSAAWRRLLVVRERVLACPVLTNAGATRAPARCTPCPTDRRGQPWPTSLYDQLGGVFTAAAVIDRFDAVAQDRRSSPWPSARCCFSA